MPTVSVADIGVSIPRPFALPHLDGRLHEEAVAIRGAEVEVVGDGGAEVFDRGRGRDLEQLRKIRCEAVSCILCEKEKKEKKR